MSFLQSRGEDFELAGVARQRHFNDDLFMDCMQRQEQISYLLEAGADTGVLARLQTALKHSLQAHYVGYTVSLADSFLDRDLPSLCPTATVNNKELFSLLKPDGGQQVAIQQDVQMMLSHRTTDPVISKAIRPVLSSFLALLKDICKKCRDQGECDGALSPLFEAMRGIVASIGHVLVEEPSLRLYGYDPKADAIIETAVKQSVTFEALSAASALEGDILDSLRQHAEQIFACHQACLLLHAKCSGISRRLETVEVTGTAMLNQLEGVLHVTTRLKKHWRTLRSTCASDLSQYHKALLREDAKESEAGCVLEETLNSLQADLEAIHSHQRAICVSSNTIVEEGPKEHIARVRVDGKQHRQYITSWLTAVETYRYTRTRYHCLLEVVHRRCKALEAGQTQCTALISATGRLEEALRSLVLLLKKEVLDPERCALHVNLWSTRQDLLQMCRKLYLSAGILLYKQHIRCDEVQNKSLKVEVCLEDAAALYQETKGFFALAGAPLPPPPEYELEHILSTRKQEVLAYLQKANRSGCPLLESFV